MSTPFQPTQFKLFHGALIAFCLAIGGREVWLVGKHVARAVLPLCGVAFCTLGVAYGIVALWMAPFLDDRPERSLRQLPLGPKRMKRILALSELLPEQTPPGWTPFTSAKGTATFFAFASSGRVVVIAWLGVYEPGYQLHIALGARHGDCVSDTGVAEILAHFRGVGPFVETEPERSLIPELFPHIRAWVALPYETIEKAPVPARPPAILDKPLNAHLVAVRKHLPAKLPKGWSVPLAITEVRENYKDGAWLVHEDDLAFVAMLVGSQGRAKLLVTIFHPSGETVNEGRAYLVLKHFRGVSEFAQCDDDGEIAGARTYLGEIEASSAERPLLS